MITVAIQIAAVVLLTLLNGLFAMSETVLVSSRKTRLRRRAESGDRGAAAVVLADEPNRFLLTVQIGISTIGVLAGAHRVRSIHNRFSRRGAPMGCSPRRFGCPVRGATASTSGERLVVIRGHPLSRACPACPYPPARERSGVSSLAPGVFVGTRTANRPRGANSSPLRSSPPWLSRRPGGSEPGRPRHRPRRCSRCRASSGRQGPRRPCPAGRLRAAARGGRS